MQKRCVSSQLSDILWALKISVNAAVYGWNDVEAHPRPPVTIHDQ
jgi:hypothetical protein